MAIAWCNRNNGTDIKAIFKWDEGVIGVTFGLRGTMKSPEIKINPVSALAPGFLRKMFEFRGSGALQEKPPRVLGDERINDNR